MNGPLPTTPSADQTAFVVKAPTSVWSSQTVWILLVAPAIALAIALILHLLHKSHPPVLGSAGVIYGFVVTALTLGFAIFQVFFRTQSRLS